MKEEVKNNIIIISLRTKPYNSPLFVPPPRPTISTRSISRNTGLVDQQLARDGAARPGYYANEFSLPSRKRERVQLRSKLSNGVSPRRPSPSPIKQMKFLLETGNEEITGRAFVPRARFNIVKTLDPRESSHVERGRRFKNARVCAFHSKLKLLLPRVEASSIDKKEKTDDCSF